MAETVMVFGLGQLGTTALEFLARSEGVDRIVVSDKRKTAYRANGAAISCTFQGFSKEFESYDNDINDIDATAKLLDKIRPNVILCLVCIQPPGVWHVISRSEATPLSRSIRERLYMAGYGAQLPFQVLLPAKLMQAVEKSGIQTHVVNASFPDAVGPVIWKHFGFGPVVGLGNLSMKVAGIRKYVSMTEGVALQDVTLYIVGGHALADRGSKEGIPFFVKILLGDRDITSKYDHNWLIDDCMPASFRTINAMTAASAVKNVMAIIRDTNELTYAPAPNGLIGGYPVRLSAKGAEVVLPKELSLEQAVKINEEGERFDGIEKIKDDGTIVYTDKAYSVMKELGYDCKELPFDELESRCEELKAFQQKLAVAGEK